MNETTAKGAIGLAAVLIVIILVMMFFAFREADRLLQTDFPEPAPVMEPVNPEALYLEPARVAPAKPAASIEQPAAVIEEQGDVYWSDVPRDWKVCVNEARVYSNPGENADWYLYSLADETPVMVRELDSSRTFAMIERARYVKFTELCRP